MCIVAKLLWHVNELTGWVQHVLSDVRASPDYTIKRSLTLCTSTFESKANAANSSQRICKFT